MRPAQCSVFASPFSSSGGRCEATRSLRYTDVTASTASAVRSLDTPIKLAAQHVRDDQVGFVGMMRGQSTSSCNEELHEMHSSPNNIRVIK
jgi:hypothetical protein